MRSFVIDVTVLFLPLLACLAEGENNGIQPRRKAKTHTLPGHHKPRIISFDTEEGKINIDWDVSIPFLSIPLTLEPSENGEVSPLLNVNTKGISILGLVTAFFTFIVPLFSKTAPHMHYRSDGDMEWTSLSNTITGALLGNDYVAPCMQRIICSIVSVATNAENPSSTEKIIDGLSSHRWFRDLMNGTMIDEAVAVGRSREPDCSAAYKSCLVTPKLLTTVMNQFGVM